jgi:hypothetical protein
VPSCLVVNNPWINSVNGRIFTTEARRHRDRAMINLETVFLTTDTTEGHGYQKLRLKWAVTQRVSKLRPVIIFVSAFIRAYLCNPW